MVYKWRDGARQKGPAQIVGETIEALRQEHGGVLSAPDVVSAARNKSSPLHSHFEWNDRAAAAAYRVDQARELISDIVVVFTEEVPNAPPEAVRAFMNLNDRGRGTPAYTSTMDAMRDPAMRALVLRQAHEELDGWRRRYRQYGELATAVAAVEQAISAVSENAA